MTPHEVLAKLIAEINRMESTLPPGPDGCIPPMISDLPKLAEEPRLKLVGITAGFLIQYDPLRGDKHHRVKVVRLEDDPGNGEVLFECNYRYWHRGRLTTSECDYPLDAKALPFFEEVNALIDSTVR